MKKPCIIIYTPQEYNHASYIHAGLFELAKKGIIEVKVKLYTKKNIGHIVAVLNQGAYKTPKAFPKVSLYQLIDTDKNLSINFAVDMYDLENRFPLHALQHYDYVFKRSYNSKYINELPDNYRSKIHKLGLTLPLNSEHSQNNFKLWLGLLTNTLKLNIKQDKHDFSRVSKAIRTLNNEWKFVKKSRTIDRFDSYVTPAENQILFQTRCFPHDNNKDVKEVHQQRYNIIRRLNKEFPDRFKGGFIDSSIARSQFFDALTSVPSEPSLYLNALSKAKIVIYTKGLSNSPAWKLAEYMSLGKVIMAEPLSTELPVPLEHGKHLLFFNSSEELVENIKMVLKNKDIMDTMSKEAREYYENEIHPEKKVRQLIKSMVELS